MKKLTCVRVCCGPKFGFFPHFSLGPGPINRQLTWSISGSNLEILHWAARGMDCSDRLEYFWVSKKSKTIVRIIIYTTLKLPS